MSRFVLTLDLRDDPEVIARYREYHARVWPDVERSLMASGVRAMDVHLLGRRLVMVLDLEEGLEPRGVFARHIAMGPDVKRWEALMKTMQEPAPGARAGEWWAQMERVYRLPDVHERPPAAPDSRSLTHG